jgi:3-oxoacyl-[acyl-carrier-protein] synthase-3
MDSRYVEIRGLGHYLPKRIVMGADIDRLLDEKPGWTDSYVGVKQRRWVEPGVETTTFMAVEAIHEAVADAGIRLEDIDLICYTGASLEQPIPATSTRIQRELGLGDSGISCFDINSTCLSWVTALDTLSYLIAAGRYRNAIIVSSEIASVGINPKQKESFALFGDGAVAAVVGPSRGTAKILKGLHRTYGDGHDLCQIRGGGTRLPAPTYTKEQHETYLFDMDGRGVFKLSLKKLPLFMEELFEDTELSMEDIDMVVPHQASPSGMALIRKKLKIPESKFMEIIEDHGNMISASVPMALYIGVKSGRIRRGDRLLLVGTGAGLSIGAVLLEY